MIRIYKNIEKPLNIMGIRGRYIYVMLVCGAVCFITAVIVSSVMSSIAGVGAGFLLFFLAYLAVSVIQHRYSENELAKMISDLGAAEYIKIHTKPWEKGN